MQTPTIRSGRLTLKSVLRSKWEKNFSEIGRHGSYGKTRMGIALNAMNLSPPKRAGISIMSCIVSMAGRTFCPTCVYYIRIATEKYTEKNRLQRCRVRSPRAFERLEPCMEKFIRTVLRGWGAVMPSGYPIM